MKQWILKAENPQKIGIYYFCGFYANKPRWECSWLRCGKTKVYKSYKTVQNNIKRLKAIYPNYIISMCEIGEGTTGTELQIWIDNSTIEIKHFDSISDAENHTKSRGIEKKDYVIEPQYIVV